MKVAIIGAGNVGKALAGSAVAAGHSVTLSASDASHADAAARATRARSASSNHEAVRDAELVLLAVPGDRVDEVIEELNSDLDGKVVVDVTNRLDMRDPTSTLDGSSNAERIQAKAPRAHVVKAFNYAFASRMAEPTAEGIQLDAFVAGNDQPAKEKVARFAESIGFRPIDAGPLGMARALEAMAVLNIALQIQHGWPWQSGWKMVGPTGDGS